MPVAAINLFVNDFNVHRLSPTGLSLNPHADANPTSVVLWQLVNLSVTSYASC